MVPDPVPRRSAQRNQACLSLRLSGDCPPPWILRALCRSRRDAQGEDSALPLSSLRPDLLGLATPPITLSIHSRRAAARGFRPEGGDPNPRSGPSAPRRGGRLPPTSVECLDQARNHPQRRLRPTGFKHGFRRRLALGKLASVIRLGGKDALFSFRTPPHFALGQPPLPATACLSFAFGRRGLSVPHNGVFGRGPAA